MRKVIVLITLLCMLCGLAVSAGAATAANSMNAYATVSSDGSAQVTLTVHIHLDQTAEDLRFALPEKASNITVNGARARSRVENGLRQVDISGIVGKVVGDFTLTFTYNLSKLIVTNAADQLELQLPLLAGFAYPVQALEISVTLPGPVTAKPAFSSGYHQANIEKDLICTTSGATITAVSQVEFKDHETLSMSLLVTEEMFPQPRLVAPDLGLVNTLITVLLVLAFVYWALFLRNLPGWPKACATPPDGYGAGEMGSILCLQGADLNMMVFSWARLGYLLIHLEPSGKVRLYKQMDMGNERSNFEQRCFQMLFDRRDFVDATTTRYAALYKQIQKKRPNLGAFMHPKSGNLTVFRGMAALVGMLYGVSVAIGMSTGAALQWLLVMVLGAVALYSSFRIQTWAANLLVADRRELWIALCLCGGWLLLGAVAGQFSAALGMVLSQLSMGLLSASGGRRTFAGRQAMGDVLGLRRYLKTLSRSQIESICRNNPEYFHQMMPYAMALSVDKAFAKRFGKLPISQCPYIATGTDSTLRASQWRNMMRRVLGAMNTRLPSPWQKKLKEMVQILLKPEHFSK